MTFLHTFREVVWPWLESLSKEEEDRNTARNRNDRVRIDTLRLSRDSQVALEEARRMADSESERRRVTDQKAAIYLPLVAALIPLILTVVSALWEKKNTGSAPTWLNMFLLGLAVAYTAAAGLWAFRVLEVKISHEAGLSDFETAWGRRNPAQSFTRRILLYTRLNHDGINWKVSCIKMAHAFLLRAFITFSILLILNIGWYFVAAISTAVSPTSDQVLGTPQGAIVAVVAMDRLTEQLKTQEAWKVLAGECHAHRGVLTRDTTTSSPARFGVMLASLNPLASERGVVRTISLSCAGRKIGRIRAWYIPTRFAAQSETTTFPIGLSERGGKTVIKLASLWPPANPKALTVKLPAILASQQIVLHGPDNRPLGVIVTNVAPGVLELR